jgi:hypothetical protein
MKQYTFGEIMHMTPQTYLYTVEFTTENGDKCAVHFGDWSDSIIDFVNVITRSGFPCTISYQSVIEIKENRCDISL